MAQEALVEQVAKQIHQQTASVAQDERPSIPLESFP